jgi:hypothetical protein
MIEAIKWRPGEAVEQSRSGTGDAVIAAGRSPGASNPA